MFDLFGIKKLKMTIEQLQADNAQLKGALFQANNANRELNDQVKATKTQLDIFNNRIKYLEGELNMKNAQNRAATQFNDRDKNY